MSSSFAELGVPAALVSRLAAAGLTVPTPIQAATLPDLLAGRDVCAAAPTGSGKTVAFALPLATRVGRAEPRRPRGLVLAPTRELAEQIHRVVAPLADACGRRSLPVYGGVGFDPQLRALRKGVDILVACPGRLEDLIAQRELSLGAVEVAVIDEADRMADMGFLPAVKRLLAQLPTARQTVLLSATLGDTVEPLIRAHLRRPRHHRVAATAADTSRSLHLFWATPNTDRKDVCADIAARAGRAIVFTRTKRGADRLARQLAARGVATAAVHGDRTQPQRDRALADFGAGRIAALVATDVAARGIHVDGVAAVIHFDPPAAAADYVHRSGRTARAGAEGVVVTLAAEDVRPAVRSLQRELGQPVGFTVPDLSLVPAGDPPVAVPVAGPAPAGGPVPRGDRHRGAAAPAPGSSRGANDRNRHGRNRRRPPRARGAAAARPGAR